MAVVPGAAIAKACLVHSVQSSNGVGSAFDSCPFVRFIPNLVAGNTLTIVAPNDHALYISVGVYAPGNTGMLTVTHAFITSSLTIGLSIMQRRLICARR